MQEVPYDFHTIVGGRPSPFGHSWSLGIEEKYYLVWPVLAFGLWAWQPVLRLRGTIVLLVLFAATQSIGRLSPAIDAWRPELILYPYSHILWGCLLAILLDDPKWYARLRVARLAGRDGPVPGGVPRGPGGVRAAGRVAADDPDRSGSAR